MTTANVKSISNGFTISHTAIVQPIPESIYAATIPEVIYWLGRVFDPFAPAGFERAPLGSGPVPTIIEPTNPMHGQQAQVATIASGGFVVTQIPYLAAQLVEVYCANMDAVADALTAIFAPPAASE